MNAESPLPNFKIKVAEFIVGQIWKWFLKKGHQLFSNGGAEREKERVMFRYLDNV